MRETRLECIKRRSCDSDNAKDTTYTRNHSKIILQITKILKNNPETDIKYYNNWVKIGNVCFNGITRNTIMNIKEKIREGGEY